MARKKSSVVAGGEPAKVAGAAGPEAAVDAAKPYVVLARKHRPETFADLIGQDAMVQTLRNAFAVDRIAQAYMLTGVRGVGKTTTARILARALNYSKPGHPDRPTIEMDGLGQHCAEIMQSRHPDVLEMDAASNTGVDNIREIIESARYKPLLARHKVFIIDEVHMLSKGAFNALLKTLEEPPPHVKFIFATTEIRKVPVTIISRCQRFDLRRVEAAALARHLARIAADEGASAEEDALALIARAAEGSVRDALSILDQAIAMGSGTVTAEAVRAMLGLADRGRILDLLEHVLHGAAGEAIDAMARLHHDGAEPVQALADLAEAVHLATRIKIAGPEAAGDELSGDERKRAGALAGRLSIPLLSRAWQMLLKGIEETSRAPSPLAAAEMVLIRLAYTADLPTPDEIIRTLGGGQSGAARSSTARPQRPAPEAPRVPLNATDPASAESGPGPRNFAEVAELAGAHRDARLKFHLEEHVSLVRFEPGRLEVNVLAGAPANLLQELGDKLGRWTGRHWVVAQSREKGECTLAEVRREREAAEVAALREHPAVAALFETFPDAEIKEVRPLPRPSEDDDSATR
jgi:DNA polymerase-3 subunit gamma/tau